MSATYNGSAGDMSWRILTAIDEAIAAQSAAPFLRNGFTDAWSRSQTPLNPTNSTPRGHLEYAIAVRQHRPNGSGNSGSNVRKSMTVEIAFGFIAIVNDQWGSYLESLQAAHMLECTVTSGAWKCGFGTISINPVETYSPALLPGEGTCGLLISQTYEIHHNYEVRS